MWKQLRTLPTFVWVLLILLGIVLFVGLIFASFYGFTHLEGLGSIALLFGGWVTIRILTKRYRAMNAQPQRRQLSDSQKVANRIAVALGILTFAFAGFALDQPGNVLYNLPVQWTFCPPGTQITRQANTARPRPGTTTVTQHFTCVDADGAVVHRVPIVGAMAIRFAEYLVIGYLLLWLSAWRTRAEGRGTSHGKDA